MSDALFLQLFRILDTNGNEKIEFGEFRRFIEIILQIPYDSDADLYFALADADRNGTIDLDEALRICRIVFPALQDEDVRELVDFYSTASGRLDRVQFRQFIQQVKENLE